MNEPTALSAQRLGVPVWGLRLQVIDGSDAGKVFEPGTDVVSIGSADGNDLVLDHPTVSRYHVEIRRLGEVFVVRDLGSTNGTVIAGSVRLRDSEAEVPVSTTIRLGDISLRIDDGQAQLIPPSRHETPGGIVGQSPGMRRLMASVEQLAEKTAPVLLIGESGTGKELIARALHDLGPRREAPYVTVDCAAVPEKLFLSELFGHERGAFTGAEKLHVGAFERADGGTLFLDELGELSAEHQSALLGVLERRKFRRLGGKEEIPVDVRIVSATHRDLRASVNRNDFRLDLYYRVAVVTRQVPALRERREDIPLIVEALLRREGFEGDIGSVFTSDAIARLCEHPWPGNVRELRNVVCAALATGEEPDLVSLSFGEGDSSALSRIDELLNIKFADAKAIVAHDFEDRYLDHLLAKTNGNVREAARVAEMSRSHLIRLLHQHGKK